MPTKPLLHGGRLHAAAAHYGIPVAQWLDLSTGINSNGWPIPPLPNSVWQRLPEDDDGLLSAAMSYYGNPNILPVAGSQAAIQSLPRLRPACRVGIIAPGYAEHAHAWQAAGHQVMPLAPEHIDTAVSQLDVLVIINPNNPSGHRFEPATLLAWRQQLAQHGGWLIVDEAYIDPTPELSLATHTHLPGLIVLRSLGKFFGLAGARVGFVLAEKALLDDLERVLGIWPIATPARYIARLALLDTAWQRATRDQLHSQQTRLAHVLAQYHFNPHGGCALFQWTCTPHAAALHHALAQRGILTRLFDQPSSLRLGLPPNERAWQRLSEGLAVCRN